MVRVPQEVNQRVALYSFTLFCTINSHYCDSKTFPDQVNHKWPISSVAKIFNYQYMDVSTLKVQAPSTC